MDQQINNESIISTFVLTFCLDNIKVVLNENEILPKNFSHNFQGVLHRFYHFRNVAHINWHRNQWNYNAGFSSIQECPLSWNLGVFYWITAINLERKLSALHSTSSQSLKTLSDRFQNVGKNAHIESYSEFEWDWWC